MTENEIGKIAAGFVTENIAILLDIAKGTLKGASREVKLHLETSYVAYLKENMHKFSKTKSFFIRNEPVNLYDFYVPIAISSGQTNIKNPTFYNLNRKSKRIAILGSGGCGKSVLMKHLFVSCIKTKEQVPIFIELRDLNTKTIKLIDLIYGVLNTSNYNFDEIYINKAIKKGHFAFILDGYDEVNNKRKKKLISELKSLSKKGENCSIFISSRPDEVFSGIDEFNVYQVDKLSTESACDLINKLPYDKDVKEKFIAKLKSELYSKHQSFLSNPLLLSIMLLTYGQNAEIPTKLSLFYNQAYEAIFQRHDALKGGYKRQNSTSLDIQDFSKVFSVFCLQTYDKRLFSFTKMDVLGYIEKSKSHLSVSFKNEAYLDDALKATCLLIEDGLQIVFSHRSFQEYFVALYISQASPEIQKKLIDKYWKNMGSDNVISLLYEINQELIERLLIIPVLSKLFSNIGVSRKIGITHYWKYIQSAYSTISFAEHNMSATLLSNDAGSSDVLHFMVESEGGYKSPIEINYKEMADELMRKYGNNPDKLSYTTKDITYRNSFVRDLSMTNGFLSIAYLQSGYDTLIKIEKKHKNMSSCVDDLLQK